ncbi:MAG TPA: HepT-like ribonuclease domain-containing protein [Candidatus Kapabacteria bacterium]|nr:HepT-like ribonuclease domain-containing protein [Candidatus Kapabacteria bacterium]
MLDAAREIVGFLEGRDRLDLFNDRKLALSIVALYQILGEASKKVSPEIRADHPEIEWSPIARMRDRIAHGYFDIDYDIIWDTAKNKLPNLIARLEPLITQERLDL